MKLFIFLSFIFIIIVNGGETSLSTLISVDNVVQRENLQLIVENGQLHKAIAELKMENANLKLDLLQTREKKKLLQEEAELTHLNCSALFKQTNDLTENLKTLWENVGSFNSYINNKTTEYAKLLGKAASNTVNETLNGYVQESCSTLLYGNEDLFQVACDAMRSNGTWVVIQRRINCDTDFNRPWADYRSGFGNVKTDFFVGLQNLHIVTSSRAYELLIEMEDTNNEKAYAMYDLFEISGENQKYKLKELGTYSGDAGDSLSSHKSQKFSSYDQGNDDSSFRSGWWNRDYERCNLNGQYGEYYSSNGMYWKDYSGYGNALNFVEMKIRPRSN